MSKKIKIYKKILEMKDYKQKFNLTRGKYGEYRHFEENDNPYVWGNDEISFTEKDKFIDNSI